MRGLWFRMQDLFPDEQGTDLKDLISDIPTRNLYEIVFFINAVLFANPHDQEKQYQLFLKLGDRFPDDLKQQIISNVAILIKRHSESRSFSFFEPRNLMHLLEIASSEQFYNVGNLDNLTIEQEIQAVKSILNANDIAENEQSLAFQGLAGADIDERFNQFLWPKQILELEFSEHTPIDVNCFYAMKFFQAIESISDTRLDNLLQNFLTYHGQNDWRGYLAEILEFFTNMYRHDNGHFAFSLNSELLEGKKVISNFVRKCVTEEDFTSVRSAIAGNDFKILRQTPLLQLSEDRISLSNMKFVGDKLRQGLIFDLFNLGDGTSLFEGSTPRKKFNVYSTLVGKDISEERIFSEVLKDIFSENDGYASTEDEGLGHNTDFIYTHNNHIVFIEFKSGSFPKSTKYEDIKKKIDDSLVTGSKGLPQLQNAIESFYATPSNYIPADIIEQYEHFYLHPVLVCTATTPSMSGVNSYLNSRFKAMIETEDYYSWRIHPVTVFNLDTFIRRANDFKSLRVELSDLLLKYHRRLSNYRESSRRFQDLDAFMRSKNPIEKVCNDIFSDEPFIESPYYQELIDDGIQPYLDRTEPND